MKEKKIIGLINGEKIIASMLKATKKVCKELDMQADQSTVVEGLVFKTTIEFLKGLVKDAKEVEHVEHDDAYETIDELHERFMKLMTEDDDDE
jgi:hypothetical protein